MAVLFTLPLTLKGFTLERNLENDLSRFSLDLILVE